MAIYEKDHVRIRYQEARVADLRSPRTCERPVPAAPLEISDLTP